MRDIIGLFLPSQQHQRRVILSKGVKIVITFASIGFLLPIVLLAYYYVSNTMAGEGTVRVCPPCMASIALDHASIFLGLTVWLLICLANAVIYAALPAIIVFFLTSLSSLKKTF